MSSLLVVFVVTGLLRSKRPGIKTPKKDELIILGSSLGPKSQADLLEKKIIELKNVNGIE